MTLDDDILKELEFCLFRQNVLKVESSFGFSKIRRLIDQVSYHRSRFYDIDFAKPEPYAQFIDEVLKVADDKDFIYYSDDADKQSLRVGNGSSLNGAFEAGEKHLGGQIFFFSNCRRMTVDQCFYLSGLTVHINNCPELRSTQLFIESADWWHRPDFYKERTGTEIGGSLSYVRAEYMKFQERFDINAIDRKLDKNILSVDQSINIYGPHLSGKTAALYVLSHQLEFNFSIIHGLRPLITVYPEMAGTEGGKLFLSEVVGRNIAHDQRLYIDDAHLLHPEVLAYVSTHFPLVVCSSLEKMEGFGQYLDTETFGAKK